MEIKEIVLVQKAKLQNIISSREWAPGEFVFNNGRCQVLAQSALRFNLVVAGEQVIFID